MQGVTELLTKGSTQSLDFASACCPSHKGEDFSSHSISGDENFAAFAVFDGHGGSSAASKCADTMCLAAKKIYDENGTFREADIHTLFKKSSEEASRAEDNSGTTATIVFIKTDLESGTAEINLAWVGDSRGIVCHDKHVPVETRDHKLTNPEERARIMKATDNKVMILTPEPSKKAGAVPLTPLQVNLDESGHKLHDERAADITVKGGKEYLAKGEVTSEQKPKRKYHVYEGKSRSGKDLSEVDDLEDITVKGGSQYKAILEQKKPDAATKESAPETPATAKRRSSFIAQRISKDGKQRGPWCLFSGENGTSLAVTRSLGDADAARCCISIPEIVTYRVKRGEDSRVIICSDGVWDTLSSFQVFKRALRRTPAAASKRISNIVKERRYNNGLGRDDITVFIIDIFPIPRPPGCSPTCAIM